MVRPRAPGRAGPWGEQDFPAARRYVAFSRHARRATLRHHQIPMQTYIYYVAEKVAGALEMQRFAHPIHVGLVTAENHVEAYTSVLENLRPTFADQPQPLEVRFEVVMPPRAGEGVWRHGKPIDTDITFGDED